MKTKYLLSTIALTLVAGVTFAGLSNSFPVMVDLDNQIAAGNQVSARTSKNDVEFIGCGFRVLDDGISPVFSFGFCQATDSEGVSISCTTTNDNLIDAIKATSAFAFISFSWKDDGSGGTECIRAGSSAQSFYIPNFTTKGKK